MATFTLCILLIECIKFSKAIKGNFNLKVKFYNVKSIRNI